METSTPALSPRKRRSYIPDKSFISLDVNDLESEIKNRRLDVINKSTEVRKSTAPLLDLQHYNDCIKLSAENKINSKNAFSLLLIDLMAMLTKKKDSEINQNFQLASCTLDASVKIYGYRVDAVHTDVMKMAVGFGGKDVQKNDDDGDGVTDSGGELDAKLKARKKKKRKQTVVKPETLNAKNDADILLDVVPRKNLFSQVTEGNQILVNMPKFDDFSLVIIDSEFLMWPFNGNQDAIPTGIQSNECNSTEIMQQLINMGVKDDEIICQNYNNFEFGKDYDEDSNMDNDLDLSQCSNNYEFDVNASVEINGEADVVNDNNKTFKTTSKVNLPVGGYESGEEIEMCQRFENNHTSVVKIIDMKKRISKQHLEYSIFDENIFKSWAGPTYWKVKPVFNKNLSDSNKENEDGSRQVASKRTRKGKTLAIVGLFENSTEVLANQLSTCTKTILALGTMSNWDASNTTIPKDCQYKSKKLFTLFVMPTVIIEPRQEDSCDGDNVSRDNNDQTEICDEEEFVGNVDLDDSTNNINIDSVTNNQTDKNHTDNVNLEVQQWDTDNMVAVPNKVEKIFVPSFKRTKHVDIKHLKKLIWNILLNPTNTQNRDTQMSCSLSFKSLLQTYPKRMPLSLVSNLSAPQVFNALLHLTNEKCLILTQEKDERKIDFEISQ